MVEQLANNGDPDQTPRSAASDLGLHCLPITFLGVSRLQWVEQSPVFQFSRSHKRKIIVNLPVVSKHMF